MTPETEVVSCPACNHLLRVPLDLLGQPVQCPECRAMFRAPAPDGTGGMTAAELLSRPSGPGGEFRAARRRTDAALLLPAFGLMFCGVAGLVVNVRTGYVFLADPAAGREQVLQSLAALRQMGALADNPGPEQDRADAERAESAVRLMRWVLPAGAVLSGLVLLGGLSIALGWSYPLAQVGCVAAGLNVPHLCCVPGAAFGLWGLLMLRSDEARAHFGR
jgi:hypothetical protein